jgi:cell division protein ZapA
MAQVTVRINGYAYTVGCEDGQEAHLQAMAEQVESRIDSIKALGGQSGEARLLVLAALLMADELHDVKLDLAQAQAMAQAAQNQAAGGQAAAAGRASKQERDMARKISRLASRAEDIAATLERP